MSKALIESVVFRFFFLLLALDLFLSPTLQPASSSAELPPPSSDPSPNESFENYRSTQSNIVEIQYCLSNYKSVFNQAKELIQQEIPELEVIGSEYPPDWLNKLISRLVSAAQIALFAVLMAGEKIFRALNVPEPAIYNSMKEKKWMWFLMVFMVGNWLSGYFWSSGAFEVSFREKDVFSKLRMGRLPELQELVERIKEIRGYISSP